MFIRSDQFSKYPTTVCVKTSPRVNMGTASINSTISKVPIYLALFLSSWIRKWSLDICPQARIHEDNCHVENNLSMLFLVRGGAKMEIKRRSQATLYYEKRRHWRLNWSMCLDASNRIIHKCWYEKGPTFRLHCGRHPTTNIQCCRVHSTSKAIADRVWWWEHVNFFENSQRSEVVRCASAENGYSWCSYTAFSIEVNRCEAFEYVANVRIYMASPRSRLSEGEKQASCLAMVYYSLDVIATPASHRWGVRVTGTFAIRNIFSEVSKQYRTFASWILRRSIWIWWAPASPVLSHTLPANVNSKRSDTQSQWSTSQIQKILNISRPAAGNEIDFCEFSTRKIARKTTLWT